MEVKFWKHENVSSKGRVKTGGSVFVGKGVYSSNEHGCTLPGCKCRKGHWLSFNLGYDKADKTVSGISLFFDSEVEMAEFISKNKIEKFN